MNENRQIRYDSSDPSANGNAYFAVVLAALAYKTQAEIERELTDVGYQDTKVLFFRSALATGFIIEWDNVLAVAFRGSTTWREWLNNLNFWPRYTPYGRIHAGFYNSIEYIGPIIYRMILPGLLSGSKVVLTGHSRGGALATLFYYFLLLNGYAAHAVVTFGAPVFGTNEFFDFFKGNEGNKPKVWSPISTLNAVLLYVGALLYSIFLVIVIGVGSVKRLLKNALKK